MMDPVSQIWWQSLAIGAAIGRTLGLSAAHSIRRECRMARGNHEPRYQGANAQECIFHNETRESRLIFMNDIDGHGPTDALTISEKLRQSEHRVVESVFEKDLGVDFHAQLIGGTGRLTVTPVAEHEDIALHLVVKDTRNGKAVSHISRIRMKQQYCWSIQGNLASLHDQVAV